MIEIQPDERSIPCMLAWCQWYQLIEHPWPDYVDTDSIQKRHLHDAHTLEHISLEIDWMHYRAGAYKHIPAEVRQDWMDGFERMAIKLIGIRDNWLS